MFDTTSVLVFAIPVLLVAIVATRYARRAFTNGKAPKGPVDWPLIGNIPFLMRRQHDLLFAFEELSHQYGTTFSISTHFGNWVFSAEPESAKHILKDNFNNYPKGPMFVDLLQELLGQGIFAADGDQWKTQRKTFSHLFKTNNMRGLMVDTFNNHAVTVMNLLDKHATSQDTFDAQQFFYRYTFDSIGQIAFGVNINSLSADNPVSDSFDACLQESVKRVHEPLWKLQKNTRLTENVNVLDSYALNLIKERRNDPDVQDMDDLLSQYINNTEHSDEYLRDVIMNFLIAGRDTTGQTLSWFFYSLSQNPEVERKVIAEIESVMNGETPSYDSMKNLPYLEGAINETLRLFPPVPYDLKTAAENDVLPNGTQILKGDKVFWSAFLMGRSAKYWDEPLAFRPERWVGENCESAKQHPYLFIPFQAGPRVCLGQVMAYTEIKVMAVTLLRKYRLVAIEGHEYKPVFNITIAAKSGVPMRAIRREQ